MQIPSLNHHPFKEQIEKSGLRLWQVAKVVGRSDSNVSRMLNGIVPMPSEIEAKIRELLAETKKPIVVTK
jgi:hypothetical protein